MGKLYIVKTEEDYLNAIKDINARYAAIINPIQRDLLACELKLASLGTLVPGALPPVNSAKTASERSVLKSQLQLLVIQFNRSNKDWLLELMALKKPAKPAALRERIPWPSFVGERSKDYILKSIDQGGLHVTDRVSIVPPIGNDSWTVKIKYEW